jgi:hypothetical protein
MTNLSYQSTILERRENHRVEQQTNTNAFSFDSLIKQFPNIPEATAILGKAGQMPILFDLDDSRPGSIIIVNNHIPSIRKFLTGMMKSLISFSHPSSFQFVTISHYPEKWIELIQEFDPEFAYCAGVSGDFEKSTEDWIMFLTKKADERRNGRNNGPAVILFIDDFNFIQNLAMHVRININWLINYGASVRIWIVSGLDLKKNPEDIEQIELFKTRIFGQVQPKTASEIKKYVPMNEIEQLFPERNFVTKIGSNWVRFWAPKLQG